MSEQTTAADPERHTSSLADVQRRFGLSAAQAMRVQAEIARLTQERDFYRKRGDDRVAAYERQGARLETVTAQLEDREAAIARVVLSMLCNFIWTRRLRDGEHLWSIPVDDRRDFDCILSDAIEELLSRRSRAVPQTPHSTDTPRSGPISSPAASPQEPR